MVETLSSTARLMSAAAAAGIAGIAFFFGLCLATAGLSASRQKKWMLGMAFALLVGHLGMLAAQLAALAEAGSSSVDWKAFLAGTHVGQVWLARVLPALTLLLWLMLPMAKSTSMWGAGLIALTYLGLGPWGGHASGANPLAPVLVVNTLHVLAIALWLGSLPWWLWSVKQFAHGTQWGASQSQMHTALTRFSMLATALMVVIVGTGWWLSDLYMEDEGDLLGTRYGALVMAKVMLLAVALWFANRLRREFLPALAADAPAKTAACGALGHIARELSAAALVLGCAAWLAQTTPALHEPAPRWWFPFRWSLDATWAEPTMRPWILAGLALIATGAVLVGAYRFHWGRHLMAALGISSAGAALLGWALAVEAYPGTFRRAQVPYLTVSVAQGRDLYQVHCTSCHGTGGLGDGPLATTLPKPPANLSEPHTALHTAGDMFWWLTHGIPESGMPGFASVSSDEERWDIINFLRAFSQGFESRVLGSRVVPSQAWLGAINFYLDGVPGPSELKGYRETHNVLLAFLGGEQAQARAESLAQAHPRFVERRTQVIAVPLAGTVLRDDLPYPVVRSGADEIWSAYQLLTRTIANRGVAEKIGMDWQRAELLVDRFGYIRARWMAEEDAQGWSNTNSLLPLLDQLSAEPQIRPFPDDHIH